ncbi:MAG: Gmad2 immunoglobulin-like domain-containing protein [Candidatus Spechtbacterales bacterium]
MNKFILYTILGLVIVGLGVYAFMFMGPAEEDVVIVSNFEECVEQGNAIMESYPRQCRAQDGRTFTEDIGNELEKTDLIRIDNPRPNQIISSPIMVSGQARGYWFFEASFPVRLYDANNVEIALGIAQAQSEWMTEDFVPFKTTLEFEKPTTPTGTLVLERDNPSGLPENDDALMIPVKFDLSAEYKNIAQNDCIVTGCSGQICADEEVITTCEFREEYACYKDAICERQESSECGWTLTPQLAQCLGIAM